MELVHEHKVLIDWPTNMLHIAVNLKYQSSITLQTDHVKTQAMQAVVKRK
jgi:hypothetical protein